MWFQIRYVFCEQSKLSDLMSNFACLPGYNDLGSLNQTPPLKKSTTEPLEALPEDTYDLKRIFKSCNFFDRLST